MSISTADVKQLREVTGAGILDCKKALQESNGDLDKAVEFLRKKGLAAAAKKTSREANDGLISAQVSSDSKAGAMVEVNCETDFVARTDDFQNFVAALVRQVLAQPGLDSAEALLAAPYIDDSAKTVGEQLTEMIAKLGENMVVRQVVRFALAGTGMIDSYIHTGSRVGVLIEVGGADPGNAQFANLVHDIALQIAAASPRYISESNVAAGDIEAEKEIYRAQLADDKKPADIKERIVDGKLKKWYSEVVLLNQEFVKDSSLTIAQLVEQTGKSVGSPLTIRRFARFELGAS